MKFLCQMSISLLVTSHIPNDLLVFDIAASQITSNTHKMIKFVLPLPQTLIWSLMEYCPIAFNIAGIFVHVMVILLGSRPIYSFSHFISSRNK